MDDGGGEVDHRFETAVCLVASHCYAFEFFQFAEEILDQVAPFVNVRVDVERLGAPGMLRDYDLRLAFVHVFDGLIFGPQGAGTLYICAQLNWRGFPYLIVAPSLTCSIVPDYPLWNSLLVFEPK